MKRILLIGLSLIMSLGLFAQNNKEATVTFYVNYHCEQCVKKVEKNIPFEKGVKNMKANLDKKTLVITYRTDKTSKEKLQKAVEKLGYVVKDSYEELPKH